MTDFTQWLYANYIRPQLDQTDQTGWETPLSLLETSMDQELKGHYNRAVQFYATNAFLLGLRTGCGLGRALTEENR